MQQSRTSHRKYFWYWWAIVGIIVLLAFALRVHQWLTLEFHRDEFYSMLAIQMIAQKGVPILPSGMFYEHGILFSYLGAVFTKLAGDTPLVMRWVSVLPGTLAVVSLWAIGRRMFRSPWAGLLAALALAFDPQSVVWSGRARMLILAQLFVPWVVYGVWWSVRPRKKVRHRLAVWGGYLLLLLSHLSAIVLLPGIVAGWIALLFVDSDVRVRQWLRQYVPWREIVAVAVSVGIALGLGAVGQLPSSSRISNAGIPPWLRIVMPGGGFVANPLTSHPLPFWRFWITGPAAVFLGFSAMGAAILWYRRPQHHAATGSAWLYLLAVLGGMAIVWGEGVDVQWQRGRYLTALVFPLIFLLGAQSVVWAGELLPPFWQKMWLSAGVILVVAIFLPTLPSLVDNIGPGHMRYDLASAFVKDHWQNGDRIMSEHPAATYLYLHQNDLYLAPDRDLILQLNGQWVDRYTGSNLVSTTDELMQQFNQPGRLWVIGSESRIFNDMPPEMLQQMLWRMNKVYYSYGVWSLVSRDDGWQLADAPAIITDNTFENGTVLRGYTAQTLNRQLVRLTLFWHPTADAGSWKVFSHLRDSNNQTIAQSDHWLYHRALSETKWQKLLPQVDLFRDGVQLFLPPDLPDGTYRLLIGFYNPDNWQRLGVKNDQSGESAVQLFIFAVTGNGIEVIHSP